MEIAIIGGGYVGLHTALRITKEKRDLVIKILDIDEEKINKFNNNQSPIDDFYMKKFMKENPGYLDNITYQKPDGKWNNYDLIFISLSTNPKDTNDARLNTDHIFSLIKEIKDTSPDTSIVVRSTINIDDFAKMENNNINYWPEFLSQGVDTKKNINQLTNIISLNKNDLKSNLFMEKIFRGKRLIKMSVKESVFTKLMHNTLDAHLINLTNLFANISQENSINFSNASKAVEDLLKNRNKVKKPGIGYGGSCYPKDSYSLMEMTHKQQNKKLIQALDDFNRQQSYSFLEFENIIRGAFKITVLGISFKGGTNDVTRTPTLSIRNWLRENNIFYKVWEPMISEEWVMENELISEDIKLDIENSDLVIVTSDWNQFNELLNNYEGKVIDLKSFIIDNGKMQIYKIGNTN